MIADDLERLMTIVGDPDIIPGELEQSGRAPGGVDVVVDDEDPGADGGGRGRPGVRLGPRSGRIVGVTGNLDGVGSWSLLLDVLAGAASEVPQVVDPPHQV